MKNDSHPVLSCAEAIALEKGLLKGEPKREWQAMARAGAALGQALLQDIRELHSLSERPRVLIVAGKGNNAGDAFLAAIEILTARPSASISVLFAFGEESLGFLARRAWSDLLDAAQSAVVPFSLDRRRELVPQLQAGCGGHFHICLDGLFGMNFRPPWRAPLDQVVRWFNEELDADLRAAVDLPSGLSDHPTDGALRADFSYMTGSAKRPLFEPDNAEWAGRLRLLDLGFFDSRAEEISQREVLLPDVLRPLRRLRAAMMHKRKYGHLFIVGGSRLMPGAILMSVMAAARSGVGLLTAAVPESLVPGFATRVPEAMWIGCPETEKGGLAPESIPLLEAALEKATAVLMGPGVGTEQSTQSFLEELAGTVSVPVVVDAEALQPGVAERLAGRSELRGKVVVTPHAGEFSRISGRKFSECGEEGLLEFCRESGFVTLLKGPPFTRVCDGERIFYAVNGGPVLARGGSGDILAGLAGSLLARTPEEVTQAVRRAGVWHGLAAEALAREHGQEAVRTTQLLDFLSGILRDETWKMHGWRTGG